MSLPSDNGRAPKHTPARPRNLGAGDTKNLRPAQRTRCLNRQGLRPDADGRAGPTPPDASEISASPTHHAHVASLDRTAKFAATRAEVPNECRQTHGWPEPTLLGEREGSSVHRVSLAVTHTSRFHRACSRVARRKPLRLEHNSATDRHGADMHGLRGVEHPCTKR